MIISAQLVKALTHIALFIGAIYLSVNTFPLCIMCVFCLHVNVVSASKALVRGAAYKINHVIYNLIPDLISDHIYPQIELTGLSSLSHQLLTSQKDKHA